MNRDTKHIMILGVGNVLLSDEGFGIHVIKRLEACFAFPRNVSVVDGGVLGLNLLGVISEADRLIVVDAVKHGEEPGSLCRLTGEAIPERVRAKNSLHQVDLLETLTMCQALDRSPETVILGVEPMDIETLGIDLTPPVMEKMDAMIEMVLTELDHLGIKYRKRKTDHVPRNPFKDYQN
jgi:hydrogenase maturation protease